MYWASDMVPSTDADGRLPAVASSSAPVAESHPEHVASALCVLEQTSARRQDNAPMTQFVPTRSGGRRNEAQRMPANVVTG